MKNILFLNQRVELGKFPEPEFKYMAINVFYSYGFAFNLKTRFDHFSNRYVFTLTVNGISVNISFEAEIVELTTRDAERQILHLYFSRDIAENFILKDLYKIV